MRTLATALAGLAAALSIPAAAQVPNPFERLREQNLRVATVAYHLAVSNPGLCGQALTPQPGFIAHGLGQYQAAARAGAASRYGLGEHVGVMAVVPGSPAALAGLTANAELLSVNGRELSAGSDQTPGRAQAERAEQAITDALKEGPVTLRVGGPEGERTVTFDAPLGCSSRVEVVPSRDVNAWADGERVVITTAMLDQCLTDDELALVIAHEMAHNILGHRDRLAAIGITPATAASKTGMSKVRDAEDEADRFAAGMARTAGYDLEQAATFLDRLVRVSGLSQGAAATHSSPGLRLVSWGAAGSGTRAVAGAL